MCRRVLLTGVISGILVTYQGKAYDKVSIDTRCAMNNSFNEQLGNIVLSFANSDKPGAVIINASAKVVAAEFTDTVPDDALILEYVEPEQAVDESQASA